MYLVLLAATSDSFTPHCLQAAPTLHDVLACVSHACQDPALCFVSAKMYVRQVKMPSTPSPAGSPHPPSNVYLVLLAATSDSFHPLSQVGLHARMGGWQV